MNNMGIVVGEDRISGLPDAVLLHILSFLPTKCVVSTSILSDRWRYVWTSIPILDFRERRSKIGAIQTKEDYKQYCLDIERYMNFMDKIFCFRDDMPNLKKLYLKCNSFFDMSRVNTWISIAISRKVEELYLCLADWGRLPACIFTCESLTMLELELMGSYLYLPETISLPRLKILRLLEMKFIDDNLTQKFISNCPVLEELIFSNCTWEEMNVVSISAPALKSLSLDCRGGELNNSHISIYAPSLLSFKYVEYVPWDFDLVKVPALVDVVVDFEIRRRSPETGDAARKFIGALSSAKLLKMTGLTFEALSFAEDSLTTLPTFYNLIHLEVSSKFPHSTSKTLLKFLRVLPNLETLVFAQGLQGLSNDDDGWALDFVPGCLLLHLKSVEFREFYGHSGELNAVKLFLKNARNLKRMTTILCSTLSTDQKNKVFEQLQMFPRGSPSCVIQVSYNI